MQTQSMLATHPDVGGSVNEALVRCIEACFECAQTCLVCADARLAEQSVADLRQCIRSNLDRADACEATGRMASRRAGSNEALLASMIETCAMACAACGEECGKHASMHEHCRICAEVCRRCARACQDAAATIAPAAH